MKKNVYNLLFIFIGIIAFTSCEGTEEPIFDTQNGRAIAGFNGLDSPSVIYNPSADTETTFKVGVSTLSDQDRSVSISIDDIETTLSEEYYAISTLNPVIKAGEFTADIVITTIASDNLPGGGDVLVLNLDTVDGAEILVNSIDVLTIGLNVQCPSVDLSLVPGSYEITASSFFGFFEETDVTREVVAGPGDNQFTIVDGAYPKENSEDLIITVNPDTGDIIAVDESKIASAVSFGPNTYAFQPGGRVLTCAGIIETNLDFRGSIGGNPFSFNLIKL